MKEDENLKKAYKAIENVTQYMARLQRAVKETITAIECGGPLSDNYRPKYYRQEFGEAFVQYLKDTVNNYMNTKERVLCFERKLLDNLGTFQGLSLDVEKYFSAVTSDNTLLYRDRDKVEEDKNFKQLIPYVLILCGNKILRYRRGKAGGEKRLHDLMSVGIGGHISDKDGSYSRYREGMRREIMEEVAIADAEAEAVALINDDTTEVGSVHFGVVHIVRVDTEAVTNESDIADPEFVTFDEARKDLSVYEPWSQFCLEHLDSLLAKA